MKATIISILLVISFQTSAAIAVMKDINLKLFTDQAQLDFSKIVNKDKKALELAVKYLYDNDKLQHDFTKAYTTNAKFVVYWKNFKDRWALIDMNRDGQDELIFSGLVTSNDEKEFVYIYAKYGKVWKEIFWDEGHFIGYQVHPNTSEIMLYHHRYPCCTQSSHNVNRMRWINEKMHFQKKYFLARDSGMKGNFFPKKSNFHVKYRVLKEKKMLYWSDEVINEGAYLMSKTNQIIHYQKGSYYKRLYSKGDWAYVMMVSPPIIELSRVVNANNLQDVKVFGWLQMPLF
jgi:hypothetical protein